METRGNFIYKNPNRIFKGSRFDVLEIDAKAGEKSFKRQVVDHPGAVVILPILDSSHLLMIKNVRQSVCQTLLELPAGTLEPHEDPLTCAKRELEEETGYRANSTLPLFQFYASPGFCNEILYVFLAKELTFHKQSLDETEEIEVEKISLSNALNLIRTGQIKDAKTICTLLYYSQFNLKSDIGPGQSP